MTPHRDVGKMRVSIGETTVRILKEGSDVWLTPDELRSLITTEGPWALHALEQQIQARGGDSKYGAGTSQAPAVGEG